MNEQEIRAKLTEYNRHVGKLVRLSNSFDRQRLASGGHVDLSQVFVASEFRYSKTLLAFLVTQEKFPYSAWHFGVSSWELEVFGHGVLT